MPEQPHEIMSSAKVRTPARLNPKLEANLWSYAIMATATGVGVLAFPQSANASVVFTPVRQWISHNHLFELDLNGDGVNDFQILARSETAGTNTYANLFMVPEVTGNAIWGRGVVASALPAGVTLNTNTHFAVYRQDMGLVSRHAYYGFWAPKGGSIISHFLGLQFLINGQVHFGWARMSVQIRPADKSGVQAILTGYAYETSPNTPIVTGQTNPADSSSSSAGTLGRLALGAPRLVAWRREEQLEA